MDVDDTEIPGAQSSLQAEPREQPGESHSRDEEVFRMAAFRIRETAKRVATLAHSARSANLRRELLDVCERLLAEEAALLARSR